MNECLTLDDVAPGSPSSIRSLAARIDSTADDARDAQRETRGIAGTAGTVDWEGQAADGFVQSVEKLPPLLGQMARSYDGVVVALRRYAEELEDLRQRARTASERCSAARERRASAERELHGAKRRVSSIADQQRSAFWDEQQAKATALLDPNAAAQLPTVASRRTELDRAARQAERHCARLRHNISEARDDEDAAHRTLERVREERESAEKACATQIDNALVGALENPGFFEKAGNAVVDKLEAVDEWVDKHADVLKKISGVLKTISAAAGVLSLIPVLTPIFGPIAVVAGGGALAIDAALVATGNGDWKAMALDAALMALPGVGKLLRGPAKSALGMVKTAAVTKAARGTAGVVKTGVTRGVRAGRAGATRLRQGVTVVRDRARPLTTRLCKSDPVDVATGEMVMSQIDVELGGLLPLVLKRTHLSTYREGGWFGPSWASTLDQRLEVDDHGICYAGVDGTVLVYPTPSGGSSALPAEGPRWPLREDPEGGYAIEDPERGETLHFAPVGQPDVLPLTAVSDRHGHRIELVFDTAGTLATIRRSGTEIGVETREGIVTALTLVGKDGSADVPLVRYGYDEGGRLTEVTNSSGLPLRFAYDSAGRIVRWEDRNGVSYRYVYDGEGRCVRTVGSGGSLDGKFEYDTERRRTVVTDSLGHASTYEMNDLSQVVREVDALGHETVSEWDRYDRLLARTDPVGCTTTYRYDDEGNLASVTRPDGSEVTVEYNALRLPVTVVDPDGAVWRREYDEQAKLTALVDPAGARTTYTYDERGHLAAVTNALGHTYRLESDDAGLPVAVIDPVGAVTRYERDGFGRVVAIADPVGGTTRFGWTVEGKLAWRTLPDGATEQWTYDGEGNLVEHVDAVGQRTSFESTSFDLPSAQTGPDGTRLEFFYDTELRLVSVINPQGKAWQYDYDAAGNLVTERDFNGRELRYVHDAAGQLIQRANGAGEITTYVRDLLGRVVEQRSGDALTTFEYDAGGRLVAAANPDAVLTLERDPLGRVLAESCNGRTLSSAYDLLGRRVERRTPSGAVSLWEYDASDRPVAVDTLGNLLRFSYDEAGREVERSIGAITLTQGWDANHRLHAQTLTAAGLEPTKPASARHARLLQSRSYRYRSDGHVTGIDDHLIGPRQFDLDPAGRITAVHGRWTERYAYDRAGNITDASYPEAADGDSRSGDGQGEREYAGTLIRRAGQVRFEHDKQGRVILRQQKRVSARPKNWRYTWGADDRLVGVTTPDGERWRYLYDPLGRRIAKQRLSADGLDAVEQVDFVWDGTVIAEQTASAAEDGVQRTTTWEWEPGAFRALSQAERTSLRDAPQEWFDQRFYAIVTDLVGTPTELVEPDGNLAWHQRTTLWGTPIEGTANGTSCPLRLPGQYSDDETRLNYNYFRYYDSATGRYQSTDPLGLAGGDNPHAYVFNPVTLSDPLGLFACRPPNRIYSARELMRRAEDSGPYHNFPDSFDDLIFEQGKRTIVPNYYNKAKPLLSNNSIQYRLPGSVNGAEGMYEIFVRPSLSGRTEVIMHRFFRPLG